MLPGRAFVVAIGLAVAAAPAEAAPGDRWDAGTITASAVGDAIGIGGGALLGAAGGLIVGLSSHDRLGDDGVVDELVGGMLIGTVSGAVIGTKVGGDLEGGTGTWKGTALAELAALAVSTAIVYPTRNMQSVLKATSLTAVILVFVAPVIGYQLSSDQTAPIKRTVLTSFSIAF